MFDPRHGDNVQVDLHLHLHLQVDPDEDDVDKHLGDAVAHPGEEVHLGYHQILIGAISYLPGCWGSR